MFTTLIAALVAASPCPCPQVVTAPVDADAGKRSLGLSVGGLRLFSDDPGEPDLIAPVMLEASSEVGHATALFLRVPIAVGLVRFAAPTTSAAELVVTTGGQFGIRHAFGAEFVRPFVGAQVSGVVVLSRTPSFLVGPGVVVGLETARFAESLSVHVLGQVDWFIALNGPQAFSVGATFGVTTAF